MTSDRKAKRRQDDEACDVCGTHHWLTRPDSGAQCQAHRKRKNTGGVWIQCGSPAVITRGMECCRLHGGKSVRGPASGTWVDGRASKVFSGRYQQLLPPGMLEAYDGALTDGDLLNLREETSLAIAKVSDLLKGLGRGGTAESADRVKAAVTSVEQAIASGQAGSLIPAMEELRRSSDALVKDEHTWRELRHWQEHVRRLVDTERRRLEAMGRYVTEEKMLALVAAFVEIIRKHTGQDRKLLGKMTDDIFRLAGMPSGAPGAGMAG